MGKYIYGFFIVLLILSVGNEMYKYFYHSSGAKATRLECHKQSTTFERVYNQKLIKEAVNALKSGNVNTKYVMQFSVYTPSKMGQYFTIEQVNSDLLQILAKHKDNQSKSDKSLMIDYYVYENDVDDPGKKTKEAKEYVGYIRMNFYIDNTHVYANQIDFTDWQGKDIKDRLECAINSLRTLDNDREVQPN